MTDSSQVCRCKNNCLIHKIIRFIAPKIFALNEFGSNSGINECIYLTLCSSISCEVHLVFWNGTCCLKYSPVLEEKWVFVIVQDCVFSAFRVCLAYLDQKARVALRLLFWWTDKHFPLFSQTQSFGSESQFASTQGDAGPAGLSGTLGSAGKPVSVSRNRMRHQSGLCPLHHATLSFYCHNTGRARRTGRAWTCWTHWWTCECFPRPNINRLFFVLILNFFFSWLSYHFPSFPVGRHRRARPSGTRWQARYKGEL